MAQPYIGQILIMGCNFAPAGWALCQGQLMPISENEALFQLIGTTYGGDGQETFGLPDLRGRIPVHMGQGPGISQTYQIGENGGVESVTLTTQQMPIHNHTVQIRTPATNNVSKPGGQILADALISQGNVFTYVPNNGTNQVTLGPQTIAPAGGSQPHENLQPYLTLNYVIALFGVFPNPN